MLRQLRPICWNENMPVHAPPLDCSDDCFGYANCACNFLSKINLSVNRAVVQCLTFAVSSRMSASLIGRFGYTFRLSRTVAGDVARGLVLLFGILSGARLNDDRVPMHVRFAAKADVRELTATCSLSRRSQNASLLVAAISCLMT